MFSLRKIVTRSCLYQKQWRCLHVSRKHWDVSQTRAKYSSLSISDTRTLSSEKPSPSFKSLLENSQFAEMINPVGKVVEGEVIAVTQDHMYIDFGFKFHGVVGKPSTSQKFTKGTKVAVLVKDVEVTEHFLGSSKHTSLLEADIELINNLEPLPSA